MHRYDWREFQEFLSVNHRSPAAAAPGGSGPSAPALFVVEGDIVVSGYCQNEDLEDWQGSPLAEVREHFKHREHLVIPREQLVAWLRESWQQEGYFEQLQHIRHRIDGHIDARSPQEPRTVRQVAYPHFLLDALQGWWAKMLPASYGIFIRVEPSQPSGATVGASALKPVRRSKDFFAVVRRGRFEEFGTPDFAGLGRDRARSELETVKYLSEKFGVPFQGAFLPEKDWEEWSRISDPWKLSILALRSKKLRLVPFRWGVAALVGARAYLGL